jgi:hypothetical protein
LLFNSAAFRLFKYGFAHQTVSAPDQSSGSFASARPLPALRIPRSSTKPIPQHASPILASTDSHNSPASFRFVLICRVELTLIDSIASEKAAELKNNSALPGDQIAKPVSFYGVRCGQVNSAGVLVLNPKQYQYRSTRGDSWPTLLPGCYITPDSSMSPHGPLSVVAHIAKAGKSRRGTQKTRTSALPAVDLPRRTHLDRFHHQRKSRRVKKQLCATRFKILGYVLMPEHS